MVDEEGLVGILSKCDHTECYSHENIEREPAEQGQGIV
jgi:hypothetical protein